MSTTLKVSPFTAVEDDEMVEFHNFTLGLSLQSVSAQWDHGAALSTSLATHTKTHTQPKENRDKYTYLNEYDANSKSTLS